MDTGFLWAGMALCLFALWALARHDWLRLTRPARRVTARVSGHRATWDDGSYSYAAIYRFTDGDGVQEVIDDVSTARPRPAVGALRELVYPHGRPDLARPARAALWLAIYAVLLVMAGLIFARLRGWLH